MKNKQTQQQVSTGVKQTTPDRLAQEFEITGFSITRGNLEDLGYDTTKVDDATMSELASRLGDEMDWTEDDAIEVADRFDIPKH